MYFLVADGIMTCGGGNQICETKNYVSHFNNLPADSSKISLPIEWNSSISLAALWAHQRLCRARFHHHGADVDVSMVLAGPAARLLSKDSGEFDVQYLY